MSGSMGPAMAHLPRGGQALPGLAPADRPRDAPRLQRQRLHGVAARRRRRRRGCARWTGCASWGSTAFYDAVLRGLDLLERHRGRRALVLFTDGEDMVSHATADDVQRRIEVSATPVYVVAQGKGMREPALKRVLDRVAGVSGGRAFYTDSVERARRRLRRDRRGPREPVPAGLRAGGAPSRDGGWRTIRVEVAGTKHAVRARQGYRAAAGGR